MTLTAAPVQKQSKLRSTLTLIIAGVIVVIAALITFALTEERSDQAYAPNNSEPAGAMALGNLLKDAGVQVEFVTTTAHALAALTDESTLAIIRGSGLQAHQTQALSQVSADVVMVGTYIDGLGPWSSAEVATREPVDPQCDNPDALAAGPLHLGGRGIEAPDGCYLTDQGALLATAPHHSHMVTYLADAQILQNSHLAEDGNAALAMRLFGKQEHVIWYIPSPYDEFLTEDPTALPSIYTSLAIFSVVVAAALWLWRGRRLGPVVVEPLPVQVPAAETTRGLGNLYQVNQDRGHAAQVLRAGTLLTLSKPLGLSKTSNPQEVIAAIHAKTGRSPAEIHSLLYGHTPSTDEEFLNLSHRLAMLENEV